MTIGISPVHSFSYDGARINIFYASKGQGLPRHEHPYSHATFCTAGSCVVRKEGKEYVFNKNSQPANLVAGEWHEIEALEDDTVFVNVFSDSKF